jgi:hypothetical protein
VLELALVPQESIAVVFAQATKMLALMLARFAEVTTPHVQDVMGKLTA